MPKVENIASPHTQQSGGVIPTIQAKTQPTRIQQAPAPLSSDAAAIAGQSATGEVKEATEPLSPQYAALARKERALRTQEKELQAREASFKSQETEFQASREFKERLKQNPLDVLNELGITYDQLVEAAVNQPNPEIKAVKSELQALKEAQAKQLEQSSAREKAQRDSAIKQISHDAKSLIDSDPAFETIKETGSLPDVVDLIVKTFDESGELLTVEDAAKLIEEELFEEAIKIANLKKVKAKLTPEVVTEAKKPTEQAPIRTLTNDITSRQNLSSRERAILAFKGEKF